MPGKILVDLLAPLLRDPVVDVRGVCSVALLETENNKRALQALLESLDAKDEKSLAYVAGIAGGVKRNRAPVQKKRSELLEHPSVEVRINAKQSLRTLEDNEAKPPVSVQERRQAKKRT